MPWQDKSGGGGGPWGGGGKDNGGGRGPWGGGNKNNGGGNGNGGGGGGGQPPNLEDLIRRGQERMRRMMPSGGGGPIGPRGIILVALLVVIAWLATGIYTVNPREQGIVKTFGAYTRQTGPGIGYHLPWPIETVDTLPVTAQNQINIGAFTDANNRKRDVPEESLMLTGDENIVDVNFTVLWVVRDGPEFLFNVQDVEGTIKAVAESAMREVVGRSTQQSILTVGRDKVQLEVQALMQSVLDSYKAGVTIRQVNLQDVSVPEVVLPKYRDVQAAIADAQTARNEAETYRNKTVPGAQGQSAQITQDAEAYKAQTVAQAQGEAQRFLSVYEQYKLAPDVTRERIYLETMERIFARTNKVIIDDALKGVVPYLPLNGLRPKPVVADQDQTSDQSGATGSP